MKRTALKRKTPMRSGSKRSAYRRRERDYEHMAIVRRLPCSVRTLIGGTRFAELLGNDALCAGEVQADHMGRRTMGMKAKDDSCAPMCRKHHDHRTNFLGYFRSYNKAAMREFTEWAIGAAREHVAEVRAIHQRAQEG